MSGSQTFQRISRVTIEEHRQIHFYLDQICQTLSVFKRGLTDVEPMRRLAAQLQGLKERLQEHHQTEVGGGLFQAILEVLPARRVEIDRLTNQHSRIIEILELARLHALGGDVSDAEALRVDLESFIEMFRQHEHDEERLLLQATGKEPATSP
jgi:hemerythrin-like domain-containing protein